MAPTKPSTIEEYLALQPVELRQILQQVRTALHEAIPGAGEKISYGIPCLTLEGKYVVYFSGYTRHFSLYPLPGKLPEKLGSGKVAGKGTLQFPLNKPLPFEVIKEVARLLAQECIARNQAKKKA